LVAINGKKQVIDDFKEWVGFAFVRNWIRCECCVVEGLEKIKKNDEIMLFIWSNKQDGMVGKSLCYTVLSSISSSQHCRKNVVA